MPEKKKEQVLSVRDLDITFKTTAGPVHAIRGVNIDLYKGETVALVGESGSGKTTIIKLITGELSPTSGQITVNGFDMQGIKRFHPVQLPSRRRQSRDGGPAAEGQKVDPPPHQRQAHRHGVPGPHDQP